MTWQGHLAHAWQGRLAPALSVRGDFPMYMRLIRMAKDGHAARAWLDDTAFDAAR